MKPINTSASDLPTIETAVREKRVGAGVGGKLTNREWIAAGQYDKIADVARQLVENSRIEP